jgi:Skp family chaperone for outer membrane proteins
MSVKCRCGKAFNPASSGYARHQRTCSEAQEAVLAVGETLRKSRRKKKKEKKKRQQRERAERQAEAEQVRYTHYNQDIYAYML